MGVDHGKRANANVIANRKEITMSLLLLYSPAAVRKRIEGKRGFWLLNE